MNTVIRKGRKRGPAAKTGAGGQGPRLGPGARGRGPGGYTRSPVIPCRSRAESGQDHANKGPGARGQGPGGDTRSPVAPCRSRTESGQAHANSARRILAQGGPDCFVSSPCSTPAGCQICTKRRLFPGPRPLAPGPGSRPLAPGPGSRPRPLAAAFSSCSFQIQRLLANFVDFGFRTEGEVGDGEAEIAKAACF